MKRCILLFLVILAALSMSGKAGSENLQARDSLIKKYGGAKELNGLLRIILRHKTDTQEEANRFYGALNKLAESVHPQSREILIDLLDFYLGEAPDEIVNISIVKKGKSALPLLRKKLLDPPIMNERPNEKDPKVILKNRNKEVIEIMELIYYEIPVAITYKELNASQLTRSKLFLIQKCLDKYFRNKGFYPQKLADLVDEHCDIGTNLQLDGWGNPFRYFPGDVFYFLISLGADGKELFPPIEPELHSFP
ncbi:MAG TPA: hypothetical protein VEM15_10555 [Thermodesulfobacteriota bacterium]|nr:hypothetical protein [Thermodesulfobacteriota bacterium]